METKIDGINWNQMDSIYLEKAEFTEISTAVIEVAEEEFTLIDGAFPTVTADPNKNNMNTQHWMKLEMLRFCKNLLIILQ